MTDITALQVFESCTNGIGASKAIIYNVGELAFKALLKDSETKIIQKNKPQNGFYFSKVEYKGQPFCHTSQKPIEASSE